MQRRVSLCLLFVLAVHPVFAQNKPHGSRLDRYRIPSGTVVSARLRTTIDSSTNQVNDQVDAVLADAVTQDGVELIPAGSLLHGTIVRVTAASRQAPLGQVSLAFAVVQHAETGSRAPFPTRTLAIDAQVPAPVAGAKRARRQPIDLVLPAGHPLQLTLEQPVVVGIPKGR